MYRVKSAAGETLAELPSLSYICWGKNGRPRVCTKAEAQGIVLNDGTDIYGISGAPEGYEAAVIEEIGADECIYEFKGETNEKLYAALSAQADLYEMVTETQTNQLAIMEAIAEIYEMQEG